MDEDQDVISLQDYLVVLRRQRWIVLSVTVLVVVAALAFSFAQTPIYQAQAEVVVNPVRTGDETDLERLLEPGDAAVETERLMVTSRPVAERAAEELGVEDVSALREAIEVQTVPDTRVVRILADHPDPAAAADIANTFADAYLAHRRGQAVDELVAAQEDLERRATGLRDQLAELGDGEAADLEIGPDGEVEGELPEDGAAVEREVLLAQLAQLMSQATDLGDAAEAVSGGGSILTPAEVPDSPIAPRPLRTGALAVVLGLLLGVGLAFLRDHIDDVVREEGDIKRAAGGRPILGRIPVWEDPDGGSRLATVVEPASLAGEAYRELSAGVRFLLVASDEHGARVAAAGAGEDGAGPSAPAPVGRAIMVASATPGEGKTSSAANLAVAAARVGLRTLLVETDLRKPTLSTRFGLGRTTGLTDLLVEGGTLTDHAMAVGVPNLRVLTAGTIPPNPNELLASAAMRAFEREVRDIADLVVYDTPAVLSVPDALELGRHADHTIMVARAGFTGRRRLTAGIERLTQVGAEVDGIVLNGIDAKSDAYYYSYYYAEESSPAPEGRGDQAGKRRGLFSRRRDEKGGSQAEPSEPSRRSAVRRVAEPAAQGGDLSAGPAPWSADERAAAAGGPSAADGDEHDTQPVPAYPGPSSAARSSGEPSSPWSGQRARESGEVDDEEHLFGRSEG